MKILSKLIVSIIVLLFFGTVFKLFSQENNSKVLSKELKNIVSNSFGFIENNGQWSEEVQFLFRSSNANYWITNNAIVVDYYQIYTHLGYKPRDLDTLPNPVKIDSTKGQVIKLNYMQTCSKIIGLKKQKNYYNYFSGSISKNCIIKNFKYEEVLIKDYAPNIDLKLIIEKGNLRYDFIIKKNSNIQYLDFDILGSNSINIDENNNLIINTNLGDIYHKNMFAYQNNESKIQEIKCFYVKINNKLKIKIGNYDKTKDLIIDPVIYSTFIGGNGLEIGYRMAVDKDKNAYVVGTTTSTNFPTTVGAYQTTFAVMQDVFVSKINPNGSDLVFSTFLGGTSREDGSGIAIDEIGNIYISGYTESNNFPTTNGAYDQIYNGGGDGFVTKLNPDGTSLIFSTYFGGGAFDWCFGINYDSNKDIYIAGNTNSLNLPMINSFDSTFNGVQDGFILKLNSDGTSVLNSSFIGGGGYDGIWSVDIDNNNQATIVGLSASNNYPTTIAAFDQIYNGGVHDVIISKFNSNPTTLIFSTYIGGNGDDQGYDVARDKDGNYYYVGQSDGNFPTTAGSFDPTHNGNFDAVVGKLSSNGSNLLWSTYVGGSGNDFEIWGIFKEGTLDVDTLGNVYIVGLTSSTNYPTKCPLYSTLQGGDDIAFSTLSADGKELKFSTYYGTNFSEIGYDIATDNDGAIYVVAKTNANNFPTTPGSYDNTSNGLEDAVLMKIEALPITARASKDTTFCGVPVMIGLPAMGGITTKPTYTWTPNIGLSSNTIAQPLANPNVNTEYIVKIEDGCSVAFDTVFVTVVSIPITAGIDLSICLGDTVQLNSNIISDNVPPFTYEWSPSLSLSSTIISNPLAFPSTITDYYLKITNGNGCIGYDTVKITVNSKPNPVITGNIDPCFNSNENYQVIGGVNKTWDWSISGVAKIVSGQGTNILTVNYGEALGNTIIKVRETDLLTGCFKDTTISVSFLGKPQLISISDTSLCQNFSLDLEAKVSFGKPPYNYDWRTANGFNKLILNSDQFKATIPVLDTTREYIVRVTDSRGCLVEDTILVTVNELPEVQIGNDTTIAKGILKMNSIVLSKGKAPFTFSWQPNNIFDDYTLENPTGTFNNNQIVECIIIDANGCSSKSTRIITISLDTVFTKIVLSDLVGKAGEKHNLLLKIFESKNMDLADAPRKFEAKIRYNKTILYNEQTQNICLDNTDEVYCELSLTGEYNNNNTLQSVPVILTLGNTDKDILELLDFNWLDGTLTKVIETEGSTISINGVCEEGGVRLYMPGKVSNSLTSRPNPAGENVQIIYGLREELTLSLEILDITGQVIDILEDNLVKVSGQYIINYNTNLLTNGIYLIKLKTNRGTMTTRLDVVK